MALPFPTSIPVLHAAPLLHRPTQARQDKLALVRQTTECEVGRGRDADLKAVHVPSRGHAFYERDGALWTQLRLGERETAIDPRTFEAMLREPAPPGDPIDLSFRKLMARTPLAPKDAVMGDGSPNHEARRSLGADLHPQRIGMVLLDGRDTSAESLRRLLSEEMMVTETRVFLRTRPLVRGDGDSPRVTLRFTVDPRRSFNANWTEDPLIPGADRGSYHAGLRHLLDRLNVTPKRTDAPCVTALRSAGWLDRHEDADLAILANTLPSWLVGSVLHGNTAGEDRGVSRDLQKALFVDAFHGMTGSVPHVAETLARVAEALGPHALWMWPGRNTIMHGTDRYARGLLDYLDEVVMPRLDRMAQVDAADLGGFAP